MSVFFDRLQEGGPFFMYTMLLILLVVLFLFFTALFKKGNTNKIVSLISSFGLFVLIWGVLGMFIGFISAFDAIQAAGDISPTVLAGGIKVGLLSPVFGMVTFLIARLGIIILTLVKKN